MIPMQKQKNKNAETTAIKRFFVELDASSRFTLKRSNNIYIS